MKRSVISAYLHEHLTDCRLTDANTVTGKIVFTPDFPGFAGHFPGHPLVPGVCLVETVRCTLEKALHRNLVMVKIKSCRFRAQVLPQMSVEMKLTVKELSATQYQLQGEMFNDGNSLLRVSMIVEKGE